MDVDALQRAFGEALDPAVVDFVDGGAGDERTLVANTSAWSDVWLRPRALRGPSEDTMTAVVGAPAAMPYVIAPMGYQGLVHPQGELATARAAERVGVPFVLSTFSSCTIEDVAAAAPRSTRWFQSYVLRDRGLTVELARRAAASGFSTLVVTVDAPVPGDRRRDRANGFTFPQDVSAANLDQVTDSTFSTELAPDADWSDLVRLSDRSGLPLVVKGVLHPEDARAAVDAGARGIVVSNHGGRQLDGAVATADALVDVLAAVEHASVDVLVDGGLRSGLDLARSIALGAVAGMVGRPVLWSLGAGGEQGVVDHLRTMQAELLRTMALCGARVPAELRDCRSDVHRPRPEATPCR